MTPTLPEIAEAAQELLPDRNLYVVDSADLPGELRPRATLAYTGENLDATLKPYLFWRGRGPVLVINSDEIRDLAREIQRRAPTADVAEIVADELCVATAHELAHVVCDHWLPTSEEMPPVESIDAHMQVVSAWCAALPPLRCERPCLWIGHDAAWLRLMLHCCHRLAEALGRPFRPYVDTGLFGLFSAVQYGYRLGDEIERLSHVPLDEIEKHRPPEAFIELWLADVEKWWGGLIETPTFGQLATYVSARELFSPVS